MNGLLVSAAELRGHLDDPDWIVFDCRHDLTDHARGEKLYREGHVAGSFFAPVETALSGKKTGANGRHPLPDPRDFAAFLERHGVTPATRIVAYDDVGGQYAARLWWLARWIGLPNAAVLDGGLSKWKAEGNLLVAAEPPARRASHLEIHVANEAAVTAAEVWRGIDARTCVVIDARTPERFRGETEPIDNLAGRIPTAVNRPFKANLNADLTMRPAAELNREFTTLIAGRAPAAVFQQCGSGITACANLLAMEVAGLGGSKLYAGSWSEWIADPARPVARG